MKTQHITTASKGSFLHFLPPARDWLRRRREEQFEDFLYVIATRAWLSACYAGKDSHARR